MLFKPFEMKQQHAEQAFDRIDRLYLKNPAEARDGWRLEPATARVLPERWEDAALPTRQRMFPSDHGAVLLELVWQQ